MDIIHYSEEHRIFRESLRKYLAKEVIPHVEEWEEAGVVPKSAWRDTRVMRIFAGTNEIMKGIAARFLEL